MRNAGETYQNFIKPIKIVRFDNMRAYPAVFHRQIELIYILEGELKINIDGKEGVLRDGDLALTFPFILHHSERSEVKSLMLIFDPMICGGLFNLLISKKPPEPFLRASDVPSCTKELFLKMEKRYANPTPCSETVINGYIMQLMGELCDTITLVDAETTKLSTAQSIMLYCVKNYKDDISLEKISKELCISKVHITYTLTNKLNTHLREYINMLRISNAEELLLNTDMPITDIMYECGFNNQGTFNRVFRKICGISPGEYRKMGL